MKQQLQKPAVLAAALAGATVMVVGVAGVSAATNSTAGSSASSSPTSSAETNPESSLIDKLVAKFGLNKSEVQSVFNQEHTEREARHQKDLESRLSQAVTDGKITEDQKSKILAKQQEMQTFRDSLKEKTEDERHTAMENKRTELEKWATDNSIPEKYIHFTMGHGGGKGHGFGDGMSGPRASRVNDSSASSGTSMTTPQ